MRRDRANTEKFINEARITARVEHPSVVPVHRLGMSEDGGIYFSMKMIDGENLRSIIEKLASGDKEMQKKYTLRRLLEIFISGCNGIAAAHNRGILHCDLKPSNLMVGRDRAGREGTECRNRWKNPHRGDSGIYGSGTACRQR